MLEAIKMYFLPCLINIITVVYIISKILDEKIDYKSKKLYLIIVILTLLSIFNYYYVMKSLRFASSTIMIMVFICFIFNRSKSEIVIVTVIEQLILFVSEFLFFLIILIIFGNIDGVFNDTMGIIISNLSISFISYVFINFNFILKRLRIVLNSICNMKDIDKYIVFFLFILSINFLLFHIYDDYNDKFSILFNAILIALYSFMLYVLLSEKNKNIIYMKENKTLISNLNEYEKMLDYQRVNNHENKNQLLVIKEMIKKKNDNVIEYIDEIVKEKREDNEDLYTKTKRIPSGGLQGLIYQKMLLGQENGIKFNLNISSKVRKISIFETNLKLNYAICRIVGIILDNAIEETIKLDKKDREIVILMYVDEYFFIEVSNHFKGEIDLDKIYSKKYTTKGKGHGYGLALLKEIVDSNENIINDKQVINDIFTQIIKIKM